MRIISIDLRMLNASGIGTYLRNIIPYILNAFPCVNFNLLGKISEIEQQSWARRKNVSLIDCQSSIYTIAEQFELFKKTPKETTLFWSPHYNIPLFYRGKLLVTVHDVFHLAKPEFIGGMHKILYAKGMFSALKHKADTVLCVSHFTAKEFDKLVGNVNNNVLVVYNGVDKIWFEIKKNFKPHNKPYFLYVGNVKPHKNLISLLRAFKLISHSIPHDILIVGKKDGFITEDNKLNYEAQFLKERVYFTGYVNEELLHQYFLHASALVFPSLYEGFGFPPLEAMACGCPVIVSDAASLPEVCGDAALYCDPYSAEDIAKKVQLLIENKNLREQLRLKGFEQAKKFSWERCALKTCKVIEEVIL